MAFVDFSHPQLYDPSNLLSSVIQARKFNDEQDQLSANKDAGSLAASGDYVGAANALYRSGQPGAANNMITYGTAAKRRSVYENANGDLDKASQGLLATGDVEGANALMEEKKRRDQAAAFQQMGDQAAGVIPDDMPKLKEFTRQNPQAGAAAYGQFQQWTDAQRAAHEKEVATVGPALENVDSEKALRDTLTLFEMSAKNAGKPVPTAITSAREALDKGIPYEQVVDYLKGQTGMVKEFLDKKNQETKLAKDAAAIKDAHDKDNPGTPMPNGVAYDLARDKNLRAELRPDANGKPQWVYIDTKGGGAQGRGTARANDLNASLSDFKNVYGIDPAPQVKSQLLSDKKVFADVRFDKDGKPEIFANSISNPSPGAAGVAREQQTVNRQFNQANADAIAAGSVAARPEELGDIYKDISGKLIAAQNANTREKQVNFNTNPEQPGSLPYTRTPEGASALTQAREGTKSNVKLEQQVNRLEAVHDQFRKLEDLLTSDPKTAESSLGYLTQNTGQEYWRTGKGDHVPAMIFKLKSATALAQDELNQYVQISGNASDLRAKNAFGAIGDLPNSPNVETLLDRIHFIGDMLDSIKRIPRVKTVPAKEGAAPAAAPASATPAASSGSTAPSAAPGGMSDEEFAKRWKERTGQSLPSQATAPAKQEAPAKAAETPAAAKPEEDKWAEQSLEAAREAIKAGKSRDQVIKRLQQNGIDPSRL